MKKCRCTKLEMLQNAMEEIKQAEQNLIHLRQLCNVLRPLAMSEYKQQGRRGRPPAWVSSNVNVIGMKGLKRRGRPPGSKNKPKEDAVAA